MAHAASALSCVLQERQQWTLYTSIKRTAGALCQFPMQGLEKYLMTKIYHKTFGVSELDRERDEALAVRMAALGFIRPGHLDIPELYQDEKAWVLAMKELHKINNYKVGVAWSAPDGSKRKPVAVCYSSFFACFSSCKRCRGLKQSAGCLGTPGQAGVHPQLLPGHQQPAARASAAGRGQGCALPI